MWLRTELKRLLVAFNDSNCTLQNLISNFGESNQVQLGNWCLHAHQTGQSPTFCLWYLENVPLKRDRRFAIGEDREQMHKHSKLFQIWKKSGLEDPFRLKSHAFLLPMLFFDIFKRRCRCQTTTFHWVPQLTLQDRVEEPPEVAGRDGICGFSFFCATILFTKNRKKKRPFWNHCHISEWRSIANSKSVNGTTQPNFLWDFNLSSTTDGYCVGRVSGWYCCGHLVVSRG